ncbi:MAG: ABC transporter ATP-binding protein [Oscillospiraceae bacterium]|nr:ABC transporter ATP-binding protein [Oscillospiraceae bacterium]
MIYTLTSKKENQKQRIFSTRDIINNEEKFIECFRKNKGNNLKIFFGLYKGSYLKLLLSSFFFVVKNLPVWIVPILTANIITIVEQRPDNAIKLIIINAIVAVVLITQNVPTHYWHAMLLLKSNRKVSATLRGAMIKRLQQLSISFHKETPSGKLQSKIMRDVENFESFSFQIFTTVLNVATSMVVTLAVVFVKNIYVFLMFLICAPAAVFVSQFFLKKIRKGTSEFRHSMENTSADVINMIELIPVTRAHGLEKKEIKKLTNSVVDAAHKGYVLDKIIHFFGSVNYVVLTVFQLICLIFTAYLAYIGSIKNIGDIALYQSYFGTLLIYVNNVISLMPIITNGTEALNSISEILNSDDLEATDEKPKVKQLEGEYEFKNVSFKYDENSPALSNFSLKVKKGETIAFVGESGAGKSSIINLITGFYKANEGQLFVDGKDINEIDLRSYRHFISVVPQKTILFSGTVRENITYGSPDISEEDLNFVIKASQLESVIERLPYGLDTNVGEHGDKLSGGQKQRISIARAIIRNPRVIIFDEATSALDSLSEREIQKAIEYLTADRTTFIVAHRLSTIKNADRIAVIDKGELLEIGSYDELMAKKGAFYKLQSLQLP